MLVYKVCIAHSYSYGWITKGLVWDLGQLLETAKATFWIPRTINQQFFHPIGLKKILSKYSELF